MRSLVARAIAMDGHETVTAEDGAEALDILTREHGTFDLLLTDIQMPVMDGIALALAAARDFPKLKILLMTGFAAQRERASGLNAIVHDVVTKPFSVHDIRTAVAEIDRLENALSLFRDCSEMARLNRDGALASPSGDLRRALALAISVARESGGLYDPTVQALWEAHVDWFAGRSTAALPPAALIADARARVDWRRIGFANSWMSAIDTW